MICYGSGTVSRKKMHVVVQLSVFYLLLFLLRRLNVVCVLFHWMVGLCAAITDINHTYPPTHHQIFFDSRITY